MLPRVVINLIEGIGVALYLLCGVIFPINLLPRGLRELSMLLPFTYWYESLRRFLLGASATKVFAAWSDAQLVMALVVTTIITASVSVWAFQALERRARRLGRLDHSHVVLGPTP